SGRGHRALARHGAAVRVGDCSGVLALSQRLLRRRAVGRGRHPCGSGRGNGLLALWRRRVEGDGWPRPAVERGNPTTGDRDLFPPCLPLMLYAIISRIEMQTIFLGAVIPGALLVGMTAILGIWLGPKSSETVRKRFVFREAVRAVWDAKWELLIPVVAMVALF